MYFNKIFYTYIIIVIIICILFIPIIMNSNYKNLLLDNYLIWPTPSSHTITCPFGQRTSPTKGASSFHTGIDIGAAPGSDILAICSGIITFTGFKGADGYTIILENSNYKILYGHVNPNFIIKENDFITQGQIIGSVGPKYVTPTPNNPYHDNIGTTNGATTGPHLHITIYHNNELINPETILNKKASG